MSSNNKPTVVVIGDWFIDENWLVAKRNVNTSTNVGDVHYLGMHKKFDKRNITLCGASEIIEVLRHYKAFNEYHFIGMGAWNEKDNDILPCTICDKYIVHKYLTPYTIHGLECVPPPFNDASENPNCLYSSTKEPCSFRQRVSLFNITSGKQVSTNRIVRVYEGYAGGYPHQLYRFDWELELRADQLKKSEILAALKDRNIVAIIIEDHGKGVIIPATIKLIIDALRRSKKLDKIKWYIRSKKDDNECKWFEILKKNTKIQLRVADYKYAFRKIGVRRQRWPSLFGQPEAFLK